MKSNVKEGYGCRKKEGQRSSQVCLSNSFFHINGKEIWDE